jgi:hypothetical protein
MITNYITNSTDYTNNIYRVRTLPSILIDNVRIVRIFNIYGSHIQIPYGNLDLLLPFTTCTYDGYNTCEITNNMVSMYCYYHTKMYNLIIPKNILISYLK